MEPIDLRHLPAKRLRIRGTWAAVPDSQRTKVGGDQYELRREPRNKHDKQAIAIFWEGRKVGYVSAAKASAMAPLLDATGALTFVVAGAGAYDGTSRLFVDLPSLPALREYVASMGDTPGTQSRST